MFSSSFSLSVVYTEKETNSKVKKGIGLRTRGRFTGFAEEMWSMLRGSLVVFILLYSWVSHGSASVTYDKRSFIINGQRKILISGSIHYPRSTPEVPCFKCQCGFYVFMGFSLDFFFFFLFNFLRIFHASLNVGVSGSHFFRGFEA